MNIVSIAVNVKNPGEILACYGILALDFLMDKQITRSRFVESTELTLGADMRFRSGVFEFEYPDFAEFLNRCTRMELSVDSRDRVVLPVLTLDWYMNQFLGDSGNFSRADKLEFVRTHQKALSSVASMLKFDYTNLFSTPVVPPEATSNWLSSYSTRKKTFQWRRAETEYQHAIALDPNSAQAHSWYSELLQVQGRTEEAVGEAEKAALLDPVNLQGAVGWPFYTGRQYDQAEKLFRLYSVHLGLGWLYTVTGRYPQAITELEAEKGNWVPTENVMASLGQVYGLQGKKKEAEKVLVELMQRSKNTYVSPYLIAYVFAGMGDRERALSALEQGYQEHDQGMIYLKVDPLLDQFHSDPRFQQLLRGIGFPPQGRD